MRGSRAGNWLVLAISSGLCALAVWAFWDARRGVPSVSLVDNTDEVGVLLDAGPAIPADGAAFHRYPLGAETAAAFFPPLRKPRWFTYDPLLHFHHVPNIRRWQAFPEHPAGGFELVTNDLGMRRREAAAADPPDVRILVTGDSHAEGACALEETFSHLIEQRLLQARPARSAEVLNAAVGGYNLFNYLGVLERYADLEPDAFIVVVYGGNDWSGSMQLQRYFNGRPRPAVEPYSVRRLRAGGAGAIVAQEVSQALYFANNPDDVAVALRTAEQFAAEVGRLARERGIRPVFVYLPPPSEAQPERFLADARSALRLAGLPDAALEPARRIADGWLATLGRQELASLDLRPIFRASEQALYWHSDYHLNIAGQRLVAEAIGRELDESGGARQAVRSSAR